VSTHLVTIDPATVAVTDLGVSGSALDAIAFQPLPVPTVVGVNASVATANEQGPVNGVFTVSRTGNTSVPLTVNYTLGGTATKVWITPRCRSVTLLPGAASTNITVATTDDGTLATGSDPPLRPAWIMASVISRRRFRFLTTNRRKLPARRRRRTHCSRLRWIEVTFRCRAGTGTSALTVNLAYS
jgi:hypothetical protein